MTTDAGWEQTTILSVLPPHHATDRRYALEIARSLQQSLWFHEVDWDQSLIRDTASKVYIFPCDDVSTPLSTRSQDEPDEIPTAVLTSLTGCYSPMCGRSTDEGVTRCYSVFCPNRVEVSSTSSPAVSAHTDAELDRTIINGVLAWSRRRLERKR